MKRAGRVHGGFSLTEVLMAVGILGVGMTMVASVFPVAVDQSRQSRDATMAALAARSVAAGLRAYRSEVMRFCRTTNARSQTTRLSGDDFELLRSYAPNSFLYDKATSAGGKTYYEYEPDDPTYGLWKVVGSYVPVVFVTPMNPTFTVDNVAEGPWRVTIAVFKSRGTKPNASREISVVPWSSGNIAEPGEYIMNWTPGSRSLRGEAYKIGRVDPGNSTGPTDDLVFPAGMPSSGDTVYISEGTIKAGGSGGRGGTITSWVPLPGCIAAYHTIIGD